jgi:hypothetical protein
MTKKHNKKHKPLPAHADPKPAAPEPIAPAPKVEPSPAPLKLEVTEITAGLPIVIEDLQDDANNTCQNRDHANRRSAD